jgi:predicted transcriptional regulator YheO
MYNNKQYVKLIWIIMPRLKKTDTASSLDAGLSAAIAGEHALLLREGAKIVEALGKMFAPCCEVVLHDLTQPEHAIIAIECPLSGRKVGQPVTEMGLARINDPAFPDVVQNYPNTFPDGRPAKSTSIGLRNSEGVYVAAICLNLDVSLFSAVQRVLQQLVTPTAAAPLGETFQPRSLDEVRTMIERFAAQSNAQPRALSMSQRREVIRSLERSGLLQLRGAASIAAEVLGISRTSVYNALK